MQVIESSIQEALEQFTDEFYGVAATSEDVSEAIMKVLPVLPSIHLCQVEEFHTVFDHPVATEATPLDPERFAFRMRMLLEEMSELAAACGHGYLLELEDELKVAKVNMRKYHEKVSRQEDASVDALDALVDIQYFLDGTIVEFGMQNQFQAAFTEVHKANMSKAITTHEQAEATIEHYENQGVEVEVHWKPADVSGAQYAIAVRVSDGKILKNVAWRPANLKDYVKPF